MLDRIRPEFIVTAPFKKRLLRTGLDLLSAIKADRWLPAIGRWHGVVLTLHRVRPGICDPFQPNGHLEITPDFLVDVVERLRRQGVSLVDLDEARDRLGARSRERFAVLTFDDGYRDNHDIAWPLLKAAGVPATIFVATGMIDGTASAWWLTLEEILRRAPSVTIDIGERRLVLQTRTSAEKLRAFQIIGAALDKAGEGARVATIRQLAADHGVDIPALLAREMMTWDEIRALSAETGLTIGGHTVDHPSLARLDTAAARHEIVAGLDRIEQQTGRRPRHFSYPFGSRRDVSARDVALVQDLGLDVAVTTSLGALSDGRRSPAAWPRLSLNGNFQRGRDFEILMSGVPLIPEGRGHVAPVGA